MNIKRSSDKAKLSTVNDTTNYKLIDASRNMFRRADQRFIQKQTCKSEQQVNNVNTRFGHASNRSQFKTSGKSWQKLNP